MTPPLPVYDTRTLPSNFEGVGLLIDKPPSWSSFKVIKRLRGLLHIKKIGHAGTLDPMATGLLICLVGRPATRLVDQFMGLPKRYEGTLRLGEVTSSYDAETPVIQRTPWEHLTDHEIRNAGLSFVGIIEQVPPMYSAIKIEGERLYKKARRGEVIQRPPRRVEISHFAWTERNGADVSFEVECSKGTYIRSLAHDIGETLGVGAHLVRLRRTAIGPYRVDHAWTLDALKTALLEKKSDDDS